MKKWQLALVVLILFGAAKELHRWNKSRQQSRLVASAYSSGNSVALASSGVPASCVNKKYCVTVFVAPWCPACNQSQVTFKALHAFLPNGRPDVGFGVVIGDGDSAQNMSKKRDLGPIDAIIDDSGSIMKSRQIASYPTWIVNDESGRELLRKSGGVTITGDEQVKALLKQFLGI